MIDPTKRPNLHMIFVVFAVASLSVLSWYLMH